MDRERRVLQQSVQTEVRTAVNEARTQMVTNPDAVLEGLKIELERVAQDSRVGRGATRAVGRPAGNGFAGRLRVARRKSSSGRFTSKKCKPRATPARS